MDNNQLLENAYIYKVVINNEVVYIGKTYQPILDRIDEHVQRCHNKELEEAMLHNYYTFEIVYESHNDITSEVLNSIEEAFITQFQPKYNKCGVTMPYNTFAPKEIFSGGGIATKLAQKHYYSDRDIEQLLSQNAQLSGAIICCTNEYNMIITSPQFKELSEKEKNECVEYLFGKVNKFNQMTSYGIKGFRQSSYCVKEENGDLRFPSVEEKLKGIKKEKLQCCHVVFLFKTEQDYRDAYSALLQMDLADKSDWNENNKMEYWLYSCMESTRLSHAESAYNKNIINYYPLEIISFGEDIDKSYVYIDTWEREYNKERCDKTASEN